MSVSVTTRLPAPQGGVPGSSRRTGKGRKGVPAVVRGASPSPHALSPADLAHVCHELKNPMGAVLLFAQMMSDDARCPLSAAQRQRIESIEQAGRQVLDVVSDVLRRAREIAELSRAQRLDD